MDEGRYRPHPADAPPPPPLPRYYEEGRYRDEGRYRSDDVVHFYDSRYAPRDYDRGGGRYRVDRRDERRDHVPRTRGGAIE